jgi:hypothetical protein
MNEVIKPQTIVPTNQKAIYHTAGMICAAVIDGKLNRKDAKVALQALAEMNKTQALEIMAARVVGPEYLGKQSGRRIESTNFDDTTKQAQPRLAESAEESSAA